ncbi:hypothetical protein [Winogradskyella haliclonae]|nr:hypothetical protein [Winogradskyella haliclonae]
MKTSIVPILLIFIITLQSCKNDIKIENVFEQNVETNTLPGKKHFLEEDDIQIFLPKVFERYAAAEYETVLDSLVQNKKQFLLERERLKNLRGLKGNNYIFFAPGVNATYFVNTIPYAPIRKQDAQKLLGIIRQNQNRATENTQVEFTKITAKYSSLTSAQVFKAIFRVDLKKEKTFYFQHAYFISSNQKSVLLNLTTPMDLDLDPYIEKMIF